MIYRKLAFAAACLTFVVVVVGAYVRLPDAGLGCPDWPGCYGHLCGVLALLLTIQLGLGIANVLLTLPLPVAVAHNSVAAALLVIMVVINFAFSRTGSPP